MVFLGGVLRCGWRQRWSEKRIFSAAPTTVRIPLNEVGWRGNEGGMRYGVREDFPACYVPVWLAVLVSAPIIHRFQTLACFISRLREIQPREWAAAAGR